MSRTRRKVSRLILALVTLVCVWRAAAAEPLPSWNDGPSKQAILFQFVFAFDRVKALAPKHPEWENK